MFRLISFYKKVKTFLRRRKGIFLNNKNDRVPSRLNGVFQRSSNRLDNTLIIGVSATALFDMRQSDKQFNETLRSGDKHKAFKDYLTQVTQNKDIKLKEGTAFPLIKAALNLNTHKGDGEDLVKVILLTKHSPETAQQILNSIKAYELDISRFALTGGEPVANYIPAFGVDLFLTTSKEDAQQITNTRSSAAAVMSLPPDQKVIEPPLGENLFGPKPEEIRIALDGDGVLFSDESEKIYKARGLKAFHTHEKDNQDIPMPEGPFKRLLIKLMRLQKRLPTPLEWSPVRISLVTARNAPAHNRVLKTFRAWNVYVDQAFFLGGLKKAPILEVLQPHIFFDDQEVHLKDSAHSIPCARVLYPSDQASGKKPQNL